MKRKNKQPSPKKKQATLDNRQYGSLHMIWQMIRDLETNPTLDIIEKSALIIMREQTIYLKDYWLEKRQKARDAM